MWGRYSLVRMSGRVAVSVDTRHPPRSGIIPYQEEGDNSRRHRLCCQWWPSDWRYDEANQKGISYASHIQLGSGVDHRSGRAIHAKVVRPDAVLRTCRRLRAFASTEWEEPSQGSRILDGHAGNPCEGCPSRCSAQNACRRLRAFASAEWEEPSQGCHSLVYRPWSSVGAAAHISSTPC